MRWAAVLFLFLFASCATVNIYDPITKIEININPSAGELEKIILKIINESPAILGAIK